MTAPDAVLMLSILMLLLAVGYWLRVAHLAAQRNREAFAARPQTPARHDHDALERRRRDAAHDAAVEARWRAAVSQNVARRAEQSNRLPALLRKQAG